jgi:hypothetical protein
LNGVYNGNAFELSPSEAQRIGTLVPAASFDAYQLVHINFGQCSMSPYFSSPNFQHPTCYSVTWNIHYVTRPNQQLLVVGDIDALGRWNVKNGARMTWCDGHRWQLKLNFQSITNTEPQMLQFKYVVLDISNQSTITWETSQK